MKIIKVIIIKLAEEESEYLDIDLIPIESGELDIDNSRLVLKPTSKIIINKKYENDFIESTKCITHKMSHIF